MSCLNLRTPNKSSAIRLCTHVHPPFALALKRKLEAFRQGAAEIEQRENTEKRRTKREKHWKRKESYSDWRRFQHILEGEIRK